jgi:hypothetical protein
MFADLSHLLCPTPWLIGVDVAIIAYPVLIRPGVQVANLVANPGTVLVIDRPPALHPEDSEPLKRTPEIFRALAAVNERGFRH